MAVLTERPSKARASAPHERCRPSGRPHAMAAMSRGPGGPSRGYTTPDGRDHGAEADPLCACRRALPRCHASHQATRSMEEEGHEAGRFCRTLARTMTLVRTLAAAWSRTPSGRDSDSGSDSGADGGIGLELRFGLVPVRSRAQTLVRAQEPVRALALFPALVRARTWARAPVGSDAHISPLRAPGAPRVGDELKDANASEPLLCDQETVRHGPHMHTPERTRGPGRVGRPLGRGALPHRPARHCRTAPVSRETTLLGARDYREDVSREAALFARVCRPASFPVNRLPSRGFAGRVVPREPALLARSLTRRVFHVKHRIGHGLRIPAFCPDPRSVLTPEDPHGRRGGTWGQLAATHQHRRARTRHHIAPPHGISHRRMRARVPIDHGHDAPPTLLHASPALAASSPLLSAETTPQRRAHHRRCRGRRRSLPSSACAPRETPDQEQFRVNVPAHRACGRETRCPGGRDRPQARQGDTRTAVPQPRRGRGGALARRRPSGQRLRAEPHSGDVITARTRAGNGRARWPPGDLWTALRAALFLPLEGDIRASSHVGGWRRYGRDCRGCSRAPHDSPGICVRVTRCVARPPGVATCAGDPGRPGPRRRGSC